MNKSVGLRAFQNARLKKQQRKAAGRADDTIARALALHRCGLFAEAQALYREALQADPSNFDALHLLGVVACQEGRFEEAEELLTRAIAINPRSTEVHSNRGNLQIALKRFDDALQCFDKALALKPDYADAWNNRGNALIEVGRTREALASYEKALALDPNHADALSNRGNALTECRRYAEALTSCDKAVALRPQHAEAYVNRGNALMALMRFDEALASYERATALNAHMAGAWLGRGNALLNAKRHVEAFVAYRQALALKPDYYKAHTQIAWCYLHQGDIEEALSSLDKALAIKPDYPEAISNRIFVLDLAPHAEFEEQQEARAYWWEQIGSTAAASAPPTPVNKSDPARRLIVGYVSSDFRDHSAAKIFGPVLRHHDNAGFEVVCYSCSPLTDATTEEFKQLADRWRDASQLSDDDLAAQIRADAVDILVDLSGHSAGHRLGVFARKPAPLQVTAWGHAHGTGLQTIDYLFSDAVAIPADVRNLFAERIYDLPCLVTVDRNGYDVEPAEAPCKSNGFITFGVFNRISKVSDDAISVWAQVLQTVTGSRLLMKDFALDDPATQEMLRQKFSRYGAPVDRIDFLGATPRREHLLAFGKIDIALDPFPQNGGVSTFDALYMGVPVVAKLGRSVPGRVAGAILYAAGLPDWVVDNAEDYVAVAAARAADAAALGRLRRELPKRLAASPVGDNAAYTKAVEDAYRHMWADYCTSRTPHPAD